MRTTTTTATATTTSDIRVSFRDDVDFGSASDLDPSHDNNTGSRRDNDDNNDSNKFQTLSNRSVSSIASSTTACASTTADEDPSLGSNSRHSYVQLRSKLTREQTNRNPLFFYQVTRHLGAGSMGDVKLVKKRADRVGGSARRDIQAAVQRLQWERKCLSLPLVGGLFNICLEGDLNDRVLIDVSKHRSKSVGTLLKDNAVTSVEARSFEDSLAEAPPERDHIFAMKSILLDQVYKPEIVEELRNEIAILRNLDHPNIVRALEVFEFRGKISIIMEVCSGGDLYVRDPYTESEAARIITSILSAVSYMHSQAVVHRDLKFENVLFVNTSPLSEVKLIDFGLSKVYHTENADGMTDMVGTVYTMAPEVLRGSHTEKADMWSIGVIAFMLLSSAMPFYGKTRPHVIKRIIQGRYHFKARRWGMVSDEAKQFIMDLLVADPAQRLDAEAALKSTWLTKYSSNSIKLHSLPDNPTDPSKLVFTDEEEMVVAAMRKYVKYGKLKKMALMVVAHKSSSDEIGILRKLFRAYDAHHYGSIAFDDFCAGMMAGGISMEESREIFNAMDLSGGGTIRYTEFVAATIEAHGPLSEMRLAEAFDHLDCDDSGCITAENLIEILGQDIPRDEIDEIIREADLTKDNRVYYSEFMALFETEQEIFKEKEVQVLETEVSGISTDSERSDSETYAFLKEKHLQNTLHTWSIEMQLPAQEFALGCSFLHQLALGNQSDLEDLIEERPSLVNFRDYDRRTALHIAAAEGHVEICRHLIKNGARVNRADRWGGFPLDDAHRNQRIEVVNLLREHQAKFGSTSQTVNLITAASEGNVDEVKTLLEFGSMDLNQGDYDHRTALHLAAHEGHLEVVKILCKAGADVNVKDRWGDRPIDDAKKAKKNGSAIADVLKGNATTDPSTYKDVASMRALKDQSNKRRIAQVVEEIEGEMTQLPVQDFALGCSVLHQSALGHELVLEKILLEKPDLVNFRDYDRRTALHIAASEGQLEICQFLVAKGARINRVDRWGGSPLDDAHRGRFVDVVKFLRENGAKFGSTSQATNFIIAASDGDVEDLQAFLDFGSVDVNQGDYDCRTALHLASGEGNLEIVRMLCEAGANVNVEDRWGHRPLDDARSANKNSAAIMKLLLEYGATPNKFPTMIAKVLLNLFKP